ncbi:MAG: hypothetical protein V4547_17200 [Bacteroidota bacterium]
MKKKLSDYLHLYPGATIKYVNYFGSEPCTGILGGVNANHAWALDDQHGIPFKDITIYLRSLDSMTEEEFNEIKPELSANILTAHRYHASYHDKPWHVLILENRLMTNNLSFNDGMVLLRKHFDLFGLIESGIAIKKH